ncbi:N-acetyltransferase family protein [Xanthobacter sp. AM11]|uniref:GNAT family N-acetyltransferase n=1 Tax=Xanthobacter sp. AM11 TaxID=3380643 RepID=UPI0039BF0DDD
MSEAVVIEAARQGDEAEWRRLWAGYNAFYEAQVAPHVTARTWQRILDPASPVLGRVARWDGKLAGFSISVLHEGTWVTTPACYLEDLFVDPACRGQGIGRRLIADLVRLGREEGWSRLYWHTRQDNPARRLYDTFVQADDFVRYRMDL